MSEKRLSLFLREEWVGREREKKGKIAVIAALPMAGKEKKKTTRKH